MVCKRTPAVAAAAADLEKAGVAVVVATVAPGKVTETKEVVAVGPGTGLTYYTRVQSAQLVSGACAPPTIAQDYLNRIHLCMEQMYWCHIIIKCSVVCKRTPPVLLVAAVAECHWLRPTMPCNLHTIVVVVVLVCLPN